MIPFFRFSSFFCPAPYAGTHRSSYQVPFTCSGISSFSFPSGGYRIADSVVRPMCSGVLVPWMTVDCIEKTDGVSPTVAEPSSFPVPCGRTVNHGHPYRDISESIAFHRFPSQSIDARRISSQPTIFHRASSVPIGIHRFPDRRCRIMPFFLVLPCPCGRTGPYAVFVCRPPGFIADGSSDDGSGIGSFVTPCMNLWEFFESSL